MLLSVLKPPVEREGYFVSGWFLDDTFTVQWDFNNDLVTKDTRLYAKWSLQH